MLAPPAGSKLVNPVMLEGRWLEPGDDGSIVVNERFRETFPDLKPGDQIKMKISGEEKTVTVIGFFQMAGKSSGYLAYTTYEYLSVVTHQNNRANSFHVVATRRQPDPRRSKTPWAGRSKRASRSMGSASRKWRPAAPSLPPRPAD